IMVLLVFSNSVLLVIIGVIFWGIIMAIHETIIRAAIAQLIDPELRGRAYGIFYVVYAVSFLIANALIGYILDISIIYVLFYVIGCEIGAIIILVYLLKKFSLDKTKIL
ncbi:MAG: MFS transporter, partial [Candidatus Odinarchaeota archaeon]